MLDDEGLLAALGVSGQGAVGEAAAPRFVDDVDDPARPGDLQPAEPDLLQDDGTVPDIG